MQKRADTTGFIESFTGSHRFILDYLVDEVLSCQPEDVHSFLLETSILERFTSPLCNAVTGKNDGQGMLELLEQANLFIIPLDNERRWYRYHHLFADLLRSRLLEKKPDQVQILHQRACEWFEHEGMLPDAVKHALTVNEFHRAAHLIEKAAEIQRQAGEIATLTGWMNALPDSIRRATRPSPLYASFSRYRPEDSRRERCWKMRRLAGDRQHLMTTRTSLQRTNYCLRCISRNNKASPGPGH
jgi:LuxR family maltose regulon positive regulatory protein